MTATWLDQYSERVAPGSIGLPGARAMLQFLETVQDGSVALVDIRHSTKPPAEILVVALQVERPQIRAADIQREETVAIVFPRSDSPPSVFALRPDFPDTPHQNWVPQGWPASLCVDDRPWVEARLSWTPGDLVRRTRSWLNRAARGELVDLSQPLEPLLHRTGEVLVLPPSLTSRESSVGELFAYQAEQGSRVLLTRPTTAHGPGSADPRLTVVVLPAIFAPNARLRHPPETLGQLSAQLTAFGVDLGSVLRERITAWTGTDAHKKQKLASHLAIVASFHVVDPKTGAEIGQDRRAFLAHLPIGKLGEALGWLAPANGGFVPLVGKTAELGPKGAGVGLDVLEVHEQFHRDFAAKISGRNAPDNRGIMLVGAGALGSQIAAPCAREGAYRWAIIDNDYFLPHNVARHALPTVAVGMKKATALARFMNSLAGEEIATGIDADVLSPADLASSEVQEALAGSDLILDASASVAVSRSLSDTTSTGARRASAFFNPTGTACVLLSEDKERTITLRELEAQYYRVVLQDPALRDHISTEKAGIKYSGACRAVTNRIPQSRAAALSALIAGAIKEMLDESGAVIRIWTMSAEGNVTLIRVDAARTFVRHKVGEWLVVMDEALRTRLRGWRAKKLPSETGGVLVGVIDTSARSIHLVDALPAPPDSRGTRNDFERGVEGLERELELIGSKTLGQVRYVGEWHSHPAGSDAKPSPTDLGQLAYLRWHLQAEGLPPLMLILGENEISIATLEADVTYLPVEKRAAAGGSAPV